MGIREEFEKLPKIAEILKDEDAHWCDKRGMYINQRVFQDSTTGYLNGAWYAFQQQQKKIDAIVSIVREADLSNGNSSVAIVHDEIQELLK